MDLCIEHQWLLTAQEKTTRHTFLENTPPHLLSSLAKKKKSKPESEKPVGLATNLRKMHRINVQLHNGDVISKTQAEKSTMSNDLVFSTNKLHRHK